VGSSADSLSPLSPPPFPLFCFSSSSPPPLSLLLSSLFPAYSIHSVHDDTKDKDFELELTWISPQSNYKHQPVPKDLADAAEKKAKEIIEAANEMEE
jgi:hypothetical protein